jgi:hypothetical protein
MDAIIKEVGNLISSIGTYMRLIIVGVWFPGFLIFSELGTAYFLWFGPRDQTLFGYIDDRLKAFDTSVVVTLVVVFVVAMSIALGYLARDVAFAISDGWLRKGWPPTRRLPSIYLQIRDVYGAEHVDPLTRRYPVFRLANGELDPSSLPRLPDTYVREFCKQWLRLKAPGLNTEGLEVEINMVLGLVMPVALSAFVLPAFLNAWLGKAILALLSLAAAAFMMYRVNWARTIETEQAITNFLFAHREGIDAHRPDSAAD